MYEHRNEELLPFPEFKARVARHFAYGIGAIIFALGIGVVGYHWFDKLSWIDSLLNASMILGGMGPVDPITGAGAKVFAAFYALFSGLFFLAASAVLIAPWLHRLLHRFHLQEKGKDE
jgi:hypothetical protein